MFVTTKVALQFQRALFIKWTQGSLLLLHCCFSIVAGAKQIFWGIFLYKLSRGSNNYVGPDSSSIRAGASNSGLTQQERNETLDTVVGSVTRTAFGPLRYVSLKW